MFRYKLFCILAMAAAVLWPRLAASESPDHILQIWDDVPPGPAMEVDAERDFTKDSDRLIAGRRIIKLGNVTTPEAHVYLPPVNIRTGASVVICPGGGFTILAWDLEGTEVAQWLGTLGITSVVLKYRVPTRTQETPWLPPTQDTQRTISLVRQHAKQWRLDPDRVGAMGFSAGGAAAIRAAQADRRLYEARDAADRFPYRPDRLMLIYSGGLPSAAPQDASEQDASEQEPEPEPDSLGERPKLPPVFMVHTFDDGVPVQGTANLLLTLKRQQVPCELHVYESGGHGYGLRPLADQPVTGWTLPCAAWLRRAGWVD